MFRRLYVPILLIIVALAAAVGWHGASRLRTAQLDDMKDALRKEARIIHALVADDLRGGRPAEAIRKIRGPGPSPGRRVTLVATDGKVLGDTDADPEAMEPHHKRPEIAEALVSGEGVSVRRSDTVGRELMYYAWRLPGPDGGVLRIAVPVEGLEEHYASLTRGLVLFAAAALLAAAGVCFVLVRRQTAPLVELTRVAERIASGDLSVRSPIRERGEVGALARSLNAMADSLAARVAEERKSRGEIESLLAGMGEGVIATDLQQKILLFNQSAAGLLDFDGAGASGRLLWEVVREESVIRAARETVESGGRRAFQVGPVKNRHLDVSVYPWPAAGPAEGVVIVAHDATESVRYQELRKEFVANVSHELRTPLTLIKGFVETLRDGAMADATRGPEFLATIEKHVDQLTNLVSDLLELSRLESREGLPRVVKVDVASMLRKVVEFMKPAAEKRRQALELSVNGRLPGVAGDPDYLERAVSNLVDNAIKYSPEGGRIRLSAKSDDAHVLIEVADSGIGIPAEDVPRIFERFYRVDKSRSREMGGTGLGLSIVKHVVQVHGGAVDVESAVGKGSTFRVRLPAIAT
jgi:two-component system, OmpR family, phosphate regulon sensor histidine kinase PhoR